MKQSPCDLVSENKQPCCALLIVEGKCKNRQIPSSSTQVVWYSPAVPRVGYCITTSQDKGTLLQMMLCTYLISLILNFYNTSILLSLSICPFVLSACPGNDFHSDLCLVQKRLQGGVSSICSKVPNILEQQVGHTHC